MPILSTGGRKRWWAGSRLALTAAVLTVGIVCGPWPSAAQGRQQGLRVTITGDILRISGTVGRQLPEILSQILDKYPRVRTVLLDSPGGEVLGGLSTAVVIRERRLNTMVPANSNCASACVILLAAGVERRVAPGTRVGVHRWKYTRPVTDFDWQRDKIALQMAFVELGVSADIVDMMMAVPHEKVRWLTRGEMRQLRLINAEVAGP